MFALKNPNPKVFIFPFKSETILNAVLFFEAMILGTLPICLFLSDLNIRFNRM